MVSLDVASTAHGALILRVGFTAALGVLAIAADLETDGKVVTAILALEGGRESGEERSEGRGEETESFFCFFRALERGKCLLQFFFPFPTSIWRDWPTLSSGNRAREASLSRAESTSRTPECSRRKQEI